MGMIEPSQAAVTAELAMRERIDAIPESELPEITRALALTSVNTLRTSLVWDMEWHQEAHPWRLASSVAEAAHYGGVSIDPNAIRPEVQVVIGWVIESAIRSALPGTDAEWLSKEFERNWSSRVLRVRVGLPPKEFINARLTDYVQIVYGQAYPFASAAGFFSHLVLPPGASSAARDAVETVVAQDTLLLYFSKCRFVRGLGRTG